MKVVAGADFGTLSVRVTLLDVGSNKRLVTSTASYPLHRRRDDPDFATQAHADHLRALTQAMQDALVQTGLEGKDVAALALDTTGSSVVPVDAYMQPLDDYYLWCDHRAHREAAEITRLAHEKQIEAIQWCGGVYSHEWGWAKLLHWLRHNPEKRDRFSAAFEHCDMIAATLCGITEPRKAKRSVCAMGHKWLWNPRWGGFPPESFFVTLDPLLLGVRDKMRGETLTSDQLAGHLSHYWAAQMGLKPGIPIPVGAFDAHWDALGAGCREGDVVNVVGTSTCIIAMAEEPELVPGVCGVVPGSVDPTLTGVEAGLSAVGDIFDAIARRSEKSLQALSQATAHFRAGQTGLLRFSWDNGDRTVLVNAELGGMTFGWHLLSTADDEFFAAVEGTAMHTRIVLERMNEHGVPVTRVINAGGIPQNNPKLNQVYANVLRKPVLVPAGTPTSLGSCMLAAVAAGFFPNIVAAQQQLCLPFRVFEPEAPECETYDRLFALYRKAYFAFGEPGAAPAALGELLPTLRRIAQSVNATSASQTAAQALPLGNEPEEAQER